MLGLKLTHVSKRGPKSPATTVLTIHWYTVPVARQTRRILSGSEKIGKIIKTLDRYSEDLHQIIIDKYSSAWATLPIASRER